MSSKLDPSEVIFARDIRKHYPERYENLVAVWQRTARRLYRADLQTHIGDTRIMSSELLGLHFPDIHQAHSADLMNEVIPAMIERVRGEQPDRKVKILDSGCGLSFAADQIRSQFGDRVTVFGTSIARGPRVSNRKRRIISRLREKGECEMTGATQMVISLNEDSRDLLLQSLSRDLSSNGTERRMIHKNDAKWRSILELSDYPEFDLIFDSFGELLYSREVSHRPDDFRMNFVKVFRAALKKLRPGGKLYIASLRSNQIAYLEKEGGKLQEKYQFSLDWTFGEDGESKRGVVITKSA